MRTNISPLELHFLLYKVSGKVFALIIMCVILGSRFDLAVYALTGVENLAIRIINQKKDERDAAIFALKGQKKQIDNAKRDLGTVRSIAPIK